MSKESKPAPKGKPIMIYPDVYLEAWLESLPGSSMNQKILAILEDRRQQMRKHGAPTLEGLTLEQSRQAAALKALIKLTSDSLSVPILAPKVKKDSAIQAFLEGE